MSTHPEDIDWEKAIVTDEQRLDEFYKKLAEATVVLDYVELGITVATIPAQHQKAWELISRPHRYSDEAEALQAKSSKEEELKLAAAPLIGRNVFVHSSYITKVNDGFVADDGDYGYFPRIEGELHEVKGLVVQSRANYHIGFGDHVPGPYPKEGDFQEFKFCLGIGELYVPVSDISARSRNLKLKS